MHAGRRGDPAGGGDRAGRLALRYVDNSGSVVELAVNRVARARFLVGHAAEFRAGADLCAACSAVAVERAARPRHLRALAVVVA